MQYSDDAPKPPKDPAKSSRRSTVGMYDRPKTADWPIQPAMLAFIVAFVLIGLIISYLIFFAHIF